MNIEDGRSEEGKEKKGERRREKDGRAEVVVDRGTSGGCEIGACSRASRKATFRKAKGESLPRARDEVKDPRRNRQGAREREREREREGRKREEEEE